jgi:hypothetical protein
MVGFGRAYPAVLAITAVLLWSEVAFAVSCPDIPGQGGGNITVDAAGSCPPRDTSPDHTTAVPHDAFAKGLSPAAIYGIPDADGCSPGESCSSDPAWEVPLPTSVLLFGTGLAGLGLLAMRRRRPAAVVRTYDE